MTHRNIYMTDELQAIYDQTVEFVQREVTPHGEQWELDGKIPRDVHKKMGELGMFGLRAPVENGGFGLGMLASATFSEALGASTFGGFDVSVLVHTDMAGPHLINSGTKEQLDQWLPGVLSGDTILSIGVSEPDAGSDVAGMRTTAVRDGDGWRINGTKTYITNAVYGNMTIVAARTSTENRYGITMFLVPAGTEGFSVAKKLDKHGWRCSDTAELVFDNVWVADDQVLGTVDRASTRRCVTSKTSAWCSLEWASEQPRLHSIRHLNMCSTDQHSAVTSGTLELFASGLRCVKQN